MQHCLCLYSPTKAASLQETRIKHPSWKSSSSSFLFFLMFFLRCRIFVFTYGSFRHLVGLLGRGISPAPRPLPTHDNTTQRNTHIHAPSRTRTCDPNVRAAEDSTYRPESHTHRFSLSSRRSVEPRRVSVYFASRSFSVWFSFSS
jgi:hypothetical protein